MIYKISVFKYQGLDSILIHGFENYFLPTLIPQQEILFGGAYKLQFKETSRFREKSHHCLQRDTQKRTKTLNSLEAERDSNISD
jgi:hypothetical protein